MLEQITQNRRFAMHDTNDVAGLLLEVVSLAVRELRKDIRRLDDGHNKCLTIPQFRILANLWIEPANNKTLAEAVGMSVPATSRMVKMLAERGLIDSTKGLKDKREVRVKLSKKGIETFKQAQAVLSASFNERIQAVSAAKIRKAETGLTTLKSLFTELNDESELQN